MSEAATPYPLQWPADRPRHDKSERRWPIFRTSREGGGGTRPITVAAALERLNRELGRLRAQYPVVSTNLETRRDGLPRSGQSEPADPGVAVYFQLAGKPHCLPCDTYSTVAANIAAVAAHIEATRAIERYDKVFYIATTVAERGALERELIAALHPAQNRTHRAKREPILANRRNGEPNLAVNI